MKLIKTRLEIGELIDNCKIDNTTIRKVNETDLVNVDPKDYEILKPMNEVIQKFEKGMKLL
jgi:hypothetical protein